MLQRTDKALFPSDQKSLGLCPAASDPACRCVVDLRKISLVFFLLLSPFESMIAVSVAADVPGPSLSPTPRPSDVAAPPFCHSSGHPTPFQASLLPTPWAVVTISLSVIPFTHWLQVTAGRIRLTCQIAIVAGGRRDMKAKHQWRP